MKLSKENLSHISTISHDGKVLVFGTDTTGVIWYTVKQSGFEDSVFKSAQGTATGFEDWKKLPLGESTHDTSTIKKFEQFLVPVYGKDQTGKENARAVGSAVAPVQLVSGMGHLHVFRQSTDNKLLVNRFILDGMKNELTPKLEVRFKRSRQKYEVSDNMKMGKDKAGNKALTNVDALDFKDMDGKPFYEPTWKLDFIDNLHQGWFAVTLLPTLESEKFRWNIFAYDSVAKKVVLHTVRASHSGIFDIKDYPFVQPDPKNAGKKLMRTIPGIIERTLDIKTGDKELEVVNGLAATVYNLQKERVGDDGEPQLLKGATRVMLAVPVRQKGVTDATINIAALGFAAASDGTLSRVDETPDTKLLSSKSNELVLPLDTLDEIKGFIDTTPPPTGTVTGVKRSSADTVTVLSRDLPSTLKTQEKVKISGTKHYNGLHKVVRVMDETDGTKSFEIAATFTNDEAGFWEVIPKKQTGLTFDNQVVGYEKAGENLLKVTCSNHDLDVGDEVQVTGTRAYEGLYPIKAISETDDSFTIDMDYQPGEAVDLKAKKRRAIRFTGNGDYLRSGPIELDPFGIDTDTARTISAWVWREDATGQPQLIAGQDDQVMALMVDTDNKVRLKIHGDDGSAHEVTDPDDLPVREWVHYAGVVDYQGAASDKKTRLYLCRNGIKVTPEAKAGESVTDNEKIIAGRYPQSVNADAFQFDVSSIVRDRLMRYDGKNDFIDLGSNVRLGEDFTQEFWIYPTLTDNDYHLVIGNNDNVDHRPPSIFIKDRTRIHMGFSTAEDSSDPWKARNSDSVLTPAAWNHVAVTYDGSNYRYKLYINGNQVNDWLERHKSKNASVKYLGGASQHFKGYLQEVRLWNRALTAAQINANKDHRLIGPQPNLVAYYQFDKIEGATLPDQSGNGHDGALSGNPVIDDTNADASPTSEQEAIRKPAVIIPQTAPPAALTLAFWVKTDTSDDVDLINYTDQYTQTGNTFGVGLQEFSVARPSNLRIYVGGAAVDTDVSVSDGQWRHLAISWESENGVLALYKDAKEVFKRSDVRKGYRLAQADTASFLLGSCGDRHFTGSLGQLGLWSKVLSTVEVGRLMEKPLTGEESHLIGAWVSGGGHAYDLSHRQRHGTLHDNPGTDYIDKLSDKNRPVRLLLGGAGGTWNFSGKLSEIQVWNGARSAETIKDTMHLRLSGHEEKLAGNWRLGAIVDEKGVRQIPDFSPHGNPARVHGSPFVSERSLSRENSVGKKIVKYATDELVAVSQRARYRESFEFKVMGADNQPWDLGKLDNADGKGNKIFRFAYTGKSSRSSDKVVTFPATMVTQNEFIAVASAPGWFRASCEFTVPDGVAMARSFGIDRVKGKWGDEATLPATEWTGMEVRKHRIEHISDATNRKAYTDSIGLTAGGVTTSGNLYDLQEEIRGLELCEADIARHLQNLALRIDIVDHKAKYEQEKEDKQIEKDRLESEREDLTQEEKRLSDEIDKLVGDIHRQTGNFDKKIADLKRKYDKAMADKRYWHKESEEFWNFDAGDDRRKRDAAQARANGFKRQETNERENKARIIGGLSRQKTTKENRKDGIDIRRDALQGQLEIIDRHIAVLARYLANTESRMDLTNWQETTLTGLTSVRSILDTRNTAFIDALAQYQQQFQGMDPVAIDGNKLVTQGALLGFTSPMSRLQAMESARGNVELNYFDSLGNLQCTAYDASADSRNASFEQWLPDTLRPCVEFRDENAKMTLAGDEKIDLSESWTLETWFQYPLVSKGFGEVYDTQILVEDARGRRIVVKDGKYLGAESGGVFFGTGIDLEHSLAEGWHHLAVAVQEDNSLGFYLDGKKCGATPKKYVLTFSGANITDYVKWTDFANFPTTAFTLSLWIKTSGANTSPTPLSYGAVGGDNIDVLVLQSEDPFVFALGRTAAKTSIHLNDGRWHHLAITWQTSDGSLKVYKDGEAAHTELGYKTDYIIPGNGTLLLGQEQDTLGGGFDLAQAFDGSLRGLSIWNTVRPQADIQRDMFTVFKGDEPGLVGYWPMDTVEESGEIKIKDLKASEPQDGVIFGTPIAEIISIMDESNYQLKTIGNAASGGNPFGRLAEMRLWRQPLSDAEILTHSRVNTLTGDEPGLIAYYPMNEGEGTEVRDHSTGTKWHPVLYQTEWKACTGEMNKAATDKPKFKTLSFDGSNDYVEIPGLNGKLGGNEIAIEYWFKGSKNQSAIRQQSDSNHMVFGWGGSKPKHILSTDGSNDTGVSLGDVEDGQWRHVALSWKKGARNGFVSYLDGEVVEERNAGATPLPKIDKSLFLGCYWQNNSGSQWTNGQMAEVRIWTKARAKTEIIANMHRRLTGNEEGLKACYPLDSFMEDNGVIKVRDITANHYHGAVTGAQLVETDDLFMTGGIDKQEVMCFDGVGDQVDCGAIDLANRSFSFECWVKNGDTAGNSYFVYQGNNSRNKGLHIGFRSGRTPTLGFYGNDLNGVESYTDEQWRHFACTYDHTSRTQTLYVDGERIGQRTAPAHYSGTGNFYLGGADRFRFTGSLDEARLWSKVLGQQEIRDRKDRRLSGEEADLIAYWPMGALVDGKLEDRSSAGKYEGTVTGARLVAASEGLPFTTAVTDLAKASVSPCEYSTIGLNPDNPAGKLGMLRRFLAYSAKPGVTEVLPDQRIEALELKWVGNAQFEPTLLGFIEGAPPVPSENLTVDYDYNNATSVTLRESQDVSYTWSRNRDTSHGADMDLFVGAGWGVSGGLGIQTKISEGRAGIKGSLNTRFVDSRSSNVTSGSTLSFNDTLALRGEQERGVKFPHLGKRFVPKNVGYALVVSGLADMFITRLKRSRRMIGYEMRPVEGVPLDINTITFHINPAYTMHGSLDGLTGSQATSERFFRHVPSMRAQYGSLYPASYYRIKEAYDLKQQIDQWDKDREAYFWNFDVTWTPLKDPDEQIPDDDEWDSYGQVSIKREEDVVEPDDEVNNEKEKQEEKIDDLHSDMEKEGDKAKAKGEQRKAEIEQRFGDPEAREQAAAALDGWQKKMENLLIQSGKRNIVNTYVWDANGGLRAESQDFANTIEHTIGSNFTIGGTLGGLVDTQISAFKLELTALYAGELTQTSSKTENIGKTFGLDVDLFGIESKEVTDLEGKPLTPAEKVARYRFMSFYLGGNTDNFHDFFDYVVDPEWLSGNSEGARALRQAKAAKPNKTWRVLHRVTYVERPALEGVGVDTRKVGDEDITARTTSYLDSLEKRSIAMQGDLATVLTELRALKAKVGGAS
uniref:Concanavalin A-like lectin/glucanases superfamily protein n=1 Tax=Candidatus Kentrum sp. SD TaxID=2126332 RepID=A0A451BHS5_9GAMM|nr:MAG: Concanavalin A-like lectin/glucanases superfamily protein [Candidatus Kentron sp. SD]